MYGVVTIIFRLLCSMRLNYLTVVTKLEITEALCTTFSPQSPEPLTLHPVLPQLRVQVHQVSGPRMWKCLIPCHKHQLGKSLHNKGLESRECVSSLWDAKEDTCGNFFFY